MASVWPINSNTIDTIKNTMMTQKETGRFALAISRFPLV
jgi:hypothetical protein